MDQIYLSNEVAKILDVSLATIRNYAKSLERAGYQFDMKKQARMWTDKEINLIKDVQQFYANNDYTLEQCFDYIVKRHLEGETVANELLDTFTPATVHTQPHTPQDEQLAGIHTDTKTLISMVSDLKDSMIDKQQLLELQNDNNDRDELLSEITELRKAMLEVQKERDSYKEKLDQVSEKLEVCEKELSHVEQLGIFQFRKWKSER